MRRLWIGFGTSDSETIVHAIASVQTMEPSIKGDISSSMALNLITVVGKLHYDAFTATKNFGVKNAHEQKKQK